ncbi:MAG: hypothetical protein U9Q92_06345 [archaeon]|nr:hypothetical protein [archaeon]
MAKRGTIQERIIRTLLNNRRGITIYAISKQSQSSYAWTHEFLKKLEKKNLIEGTKVTSFKKLLSFWKAIRTKPKKREYMLQNPEIILKKANLEYALTTYQAENLIQNYLFPSRIDFYIKEKDTDKWHKILSKNGLVGKGNIRILITDDHALYNTSKKQGLTIVSLPQLILDLLEEGSVCEEAAEMLIKKVEKNAL